MTISSSRSRTFTYHWIYYRIFRLLVNVNKLNLNTFKNHILSFCLKNRWFRALFNYNFSNKSSSIHRYIEKQFAMFYKFFLCFFVSSNVMRDLFTYYCQIKLFTPNLSVTLGTIISQEEKQQYGKTKLFFKIIVRKTQNGNTN